MTERIDMTEILRELGQEAKPQKKTNWAEIIKAFIPIAQQVVNKLPNGKVKNKTEAKPVNANNITGGQYGQQGAVNWDAKLILLASKLEEYPAIKDMSIKQVAHMIKTNSELRGMIALEMSK